MYRFTSDKYLLFIHHIQLSQDDHGNGNTNYGNNSGDVNINVNGDGVGNGGCDYNDNDGAIAIDMRKVLVVTAVMVEMMIRMMADVDSQEGWIARD